MLHICTLQVSQIYSSWFCWIHIHIALIILWFPLGTNSKHVDLKLKKLVDVSPRRVTSPSSPSSTSSSPTASPINPTEGQEVYPHSGHSYFPHLFPFLSSCLSFSLSLSILCVPPCLLSAPSKGHRISRVWLSLFFSRVTWCTHQSVKPLHVRP